MSATKLAAQNRCLPFAHLLGLRAAMAAKPVVKNQADSTKELAEQIKLAASIIDAGKKRRGEVAEKSDLNPIAAAIIAAAEKARG